MTLEEKLNLYGWVEIRSGVYAWTQEAIIGDQKGWQDCDECKNYDFSTSPFWVSDDSGMEPEGYDTIQEILTEFLS